MNREMIIDTSLWIEYFKNNPDVVKVVEAGLANSTIYITGSIVSELLQGSKTRLEFDKLSQCIDAVPYIECTMQDWIKAGELSFKLRKGGVTIPLTDMLIASIALNRHMAVWTLDKHFSYIPAVELISKI